MQKSTLFLLTLTSSILFSTGALACVDAAKVPEKFQATSEKNFSELMNDSMGIMDRDMQAAGSTGKIERDFLAMMIPHHVGAINMAQSVLLHSKDPQVRNLALQIITDQTNEIELMKIWLKQYGKKK